MKCAAIIAAAGSGERFGAQIPKALIQLGNRTLIEHAVGALAPVATQIIITAPAGYEDQIRTLVGDGIDVVTGGATRSESVRNGLALVGSDIDYVLVHDAARALATTHLAQEVLAQLGSGEKAVIPGLQQVDTVKVVDLYGYVTSTPDRSNLRRVQTPQGFSRQLLVDAHASQSDATDDGALVESMGVKVKIIQGEECAIKITTPADLAIALSHLGNASDFRSGVGVDAHTFSQGKPLWLAGIGWPEEIGVEGHSDGDVAAHAICDALFAASGLGDLGSNFGVNRPEYAGASGAQLLKETLVMITKAGYAISHVSVQVIANRPKLGPRRIEAIAALSKALGGASVSLLATTTDGMGLTGEGKGIAAIASASIFKDSTHSR
jgi:2-C-methyl-D-erythritol 4-phosphate cytidylyltransferase/2-C-methyl-D-erythritol 2,4-cyclodiphosphate synthase